ncbi:hypothetical protein JYU34_005503 [Plutella xylostella]|uniref:Uncharacterized protein n=1 Tax=Plutella xylostella TaxID=51655 RepID=A0ABQ7QTG1_PLUXY|nr:hypothetical protein JYU34_005503 [Plutella xylostella]
MNFHRHSAAAAAAAAAPLPPPPPRRSALRTDSIYFLGGDIKQINLQEAKFKRNTKLNFFRRYNIIINMMPEAYTYSVQRTSEDKEREGKFNYSIIVSNQFHSGREDTDL